MYSGIQRSNENFGVACVKVHRVEGMRPLNSQGPTRIPPQNHPVRAQVLNSRSDSLLYGIRC